MPVLFVRSSPFPPCLFLLSDKAWTHHLFRLPNTAHRAIFKLLFSDAEINSFLISVLFFFYYYYGKKAWCYVPFILSTPSWVLCCSYWRHWELWMCDESTSSPKFSLPLPSRTRNWVLVSYFLLQESLCYRCLSSVNLRFCISFAYKNENWTLQTLCNSV